MSTPPRPLVPSSGRRSSLPTSGARVNPPLVKDLLWILHLHENLTPDADWFELAVIHHTDCGSGLLARDELRAGCVSRGGWDDTTALDMAVVDPVKTVAGDVQKPRSAGELQTIGNVKIGGLVYELKTGEITTVVEPGYGSANGHRPD